MPGSSKRPNVPVVGRGEGRAAFTSLAVAAVLLSCLPTEPCACTPRPSGSLAVFGVVQRADGAAVASAQILFSASLLAGTAVCEGPGSASREDLGPVVGAGPDGRFRSVLYTFSAPGPRCLRAVAYAGQPGSSDSGVVDGLIVQFRERGPDSLGIQLTIP